MQTNDLITKTAKFVREALSGEATGHDWWHVYRVWNLSKHIANEEIASGKQVDTLVVELAALLHDIADWKFNDGDEMAGPKKAAIWLESIGADRNATTQVYEMIKDISFKGADENDDGKKIGGRTS